MIAIGGIRAPVSGFAPGACGGGVKFRRAFRSVSGPGG